MKKYEVEIDMPLGDCKVYKYYSAEEALAGAHALSLLAEETRVYTPDDQILARFVKGKRHDFSQKRSFKRLNNNIEDPDAIDPETYGVIHLPRINKID